MSVPRIIIDDAIPYIRGVFEPYAEVFYCKGSEFASLRDGRGGMAVGQADALIVRTRTKCGASLLEGSNVKMIATATIGTDHIDLDYCRSKNIYVASAPGCNSGAVLQYVYASLYALLAKKSSGRPAHLRNKVLGVVGVGHVGSKVAAMGEALGLEVLRNDPPEAIRQERLVREGRLSPMDAVRYCPLDELLEKSDIVTLHVPLVEAGRFATKSMADAGFFGRMKKGSIFINSCRGSVVDDNALIAAGDQLYGIILDVWNGEPGINPELLARADVATPHIAGYSVEGKINGTVAAVRECAKYFGLKDLEGFSLEDKKSVRKIRIKGEPEENVAAAILEGFPVMELDTMLRKSPRDFEMIRSEYKLRNEFVWE